MQGTEDGKRTWAMILEAPGGQDGARWLGWGQESMTLSVCSVQGFSKCGSQPAMSTSVGNLLEMQLHRPGPGPTQRCSELWERAPGTMYYLF